MSDNWVVQNLTNALETGVDEENNIEFDYGVKRQLRVPVHKKE